MFSISSSTSSGGHDHRRTRSVGAAFPSSSSPGAPPSSPPRVSSARGLRHAPRRSESSIPRHVPVLPPLDLHEEGLGMPGVPTGVPARHTLPRRSSRSGPQLPPLDLPRGGLDFPGVHPAPARRDASSASPAGNRNWPDDVADWEIPLFEERQRWEEQQEADREATTNREPPPGFVGKVMVFLGYAGPNAQVRRAFVSLVLGELWWLAQFVVVIALLAVSGVTKSPTMPELAEWSACDRPLGAWNALWLAKVMVNAWLSYWGWRRGQAHRTRQQGGEHRREHRRADSDTELATQRVLNGQLHYPPGDAGPRAGPRRQQFRQTSGLSYEGTSGSNTGNNQDPPRSPLFTRLSLLTSFLTLAWFLTAHVLEYTSVNTCRLSSPHLWWLTFAILCTLYLMVLEIFLLGLLVFVLGPVLYIMYNILLLCLGRHPLQNPHYIKPDIDKLPKSVVDQIPLVLYIPPPPGETTDTIPHISAPAPAHAYPPKSPAPSSTAPKRRFMFFRRKDAKSKKTGAGQLSTADSKARADKDDKDEKGGENAVEEEEDEDVPWDEMWEKSEYPFVRLEGNRAVCAICLMDFEEPKRIRGAKGSGTKPGADAGANSESGPSSPPVGGARKGESVGESVSTGGEATQEIQVEAVTEEERDALGEGRGEGEGPEPLRLLACGHVFHKTCLDPWLTDVSGRCPICQRPVEVPEPSKKSKGRRRRRT
ncbi:hypothetical protein GSI_01873 [Ganoderma sinense ZZ0214-1]|uniref:RING-type domain-containing protein n=1 Tax=Ganoderma sinense ZZ0214-1 TaxID=1077348 RepID=A0A2G8SR40_9APHY|nr:hypothetical protein GSI_01873 [Ganoderma sinense ZZ0214-1]